jgi:hypothetical protein
MKPHDFHSHLYEDHSSRWQNFWVSRHFGRPLHWHQKRVCHFIHRHTTSSMIGRQLLFQVICDTPFLGIQSILMFTGELILTGGQTTSTLRRPIRLVVACFDLGRFGSSTNEWYLLAHWQGFSGPTSITTSSLADIRMCPTPIVYFKLISQYAELHYSSNLLSGYWQPSLHAHHVQESLIAATSPSGSASITDKTHIITGGRLEDELRMYSGPSHIRVIGVKLWVSHHMKWMLDAAIY